ncbi:MAG: hypothetical protein ABR936_10435 [Bacteroidota bacterium]|jgi:hypothetical protein
MRKKSSDDEIKDLRFIEWISTLININASFYPKPEAFENYSRPIHRMTGKYTLLVKSNNPEKSTCMFLKK